MKKHTLLLTLFLLAFSFFLNAQDKLILNEDFSSNENQWTIKESDKVNSRIENGKYLMSHLNDAGSYLFLLDELTLNPKQNFEISTTITQKKGDPSDGFGLVWGVKDAGNFLGFNINGMGQYRVYKYQNFNYTEIKGFTQTEDIVEYQGKSNHLTIRRSGEILSFYVNDHFIYSVLAQDFLGNKAGFVVYNSMEIESNEMVVRQGTAMPEIFEDAFEDNQNEWITTKEDSSILVLKNGKLYMRGAPEAKSTFKLKELAINQEKDFEVEVNVAQVSGRNDKGYGIAWGAKDAENCFMFLINNFGSYSIWERNAGQSNKLLDWTPSGQLLHLNVQPNKLVLKKSGQQYSFFLNDIWLNNLPFKKFYGNQGGFVLQSDLSIGVEVMFIREGDQSFSPQPPEIVVISPESNEITIDSKSFLLKAGIKSNAKLNGIKLLVNEKQVGSKARLDDSGEYAILLEQEIALEEGENSIKLLARDENGMVQRHTVSITVKVPDAPVVRNGTDYALFFATDDYMEWTDLVNPVNDARTIAMELETNYGYNTELVIGAERKDILKKLKEYARRTYSDEDQLLIFFAGHGKFDEDFGEGYVVCSDSRKTDEGNDSYISHSSLRTIVNNIPCKHVFLVMDVCFGGTIDPFIATSGNRGGGGGDPVELSQTEFIQRKLKFRTRKYLTSGGKEYVPDGVPGHHSPFARKFLEALRNYGGHDKIITQGELVLYFERLMPEPRFGEFGTNEPGSDFLFIAR